MLRGCQRRMIVLKNTGSNIFDEAYFLLNEKAAESYTLTETDMIREANRIISESSLLPYNNYKKPKPAYISWILVSLFLGTLVFLSIFLALKMVSF